MDVVRVSVTELFAYTHVLGSLVNIPNQSVVRRSATNVRISVLKRIGMADQTVESSRIGVEQRQLINRCCGLVVLYWRDEDPV